MALVLFAATMLAAIVGAGAAKADPVAPLAGFATAGKLATPYFDGYNKASGGLYNDGASNHPDAPCLNASSWKDATVLKQGKCEDKYTPRWETNNWDTSNTGQLRVIGAIGDSLCLDTAAGGLAAGTYVVLRKCGSIQATQRWQPTTTAGFFQLKQVTTGFCLTAYDDPALGYPATIQPCSDVAANQKFTSLLASPVTIREANALRRSEFTGSDMFGRRWWNSSGWVNNLVPGQYYFWLNGGSCNSSAPIGITVSCVQHLDPGTYAGTTDWTITIPNQFVGGTVTIDV